MACIVAACGLQPRSFFSQTQVLICKDRRVAAPVATSKPHSAACIVTAVRIRTASAGSAPDLLRSRRRSEGSTKLPFGDNNCTPADVTRGDRTPRVRTQAKADDGESGDGEQLVSQLASLGLWIFWAAFVGYAFTMAPNQTPSRDQYFIQKLLFLKGDDGFVMNPVLVALWNLMGMWPLVYASILIPSARSKDGPPVWPFSVLSTFVGAFSLLPYFALWRGDSPPPLPSPGAQPSRAITILDSKITALVAVVGTSVLLTSAATAGPEAWTEFYQYFRESRLVHVTSIDFLILTTFAPFWMYNDASVRKWDSIWIALIAVPVIGPALHCLLRPQLPK